MGNKIKIPAGFGLAPDSGSNITEGIVIEEAVEGKGNQFVWIPVGDNLKVGSGKTDSITLSRYQFAEDGRETPRSLEENAVSPGGDYIQQYFEEQTATLGNKVAKDLADFQEKTKLAGGYYIARYEASSSDGTDNGKAESKKGKQAWVNIQPGSSEASKAMYDNSFYTSDLINSLAWDTALLYIQEFSDNKTYSMQKQTAEDEILKINNMASNCMEWTTETVRNQTYPCAIRGGTFHNTHFTAAARWHNSVLFRGNYASFRPILYLLK